MINEQVPLHEQLSNLRKRLHEYTMRFGLAAQQGDRAEKQNMQEALYKLGIELDSVIEKVAKLELEDYNKAQVLEQLVLAGEEI